MDNIIDMIRKNLGFDELHKVDPNTQDVPSGLKIFGMTTLAQAAIPSIVCAISNHLETPGNRELILSGESSNWMSTIFGDKKNELLDKLAEYSNMPVSTVQQEAEHIANEAIRVVRVALPDSSHESAIQSFAAASRREALLYLPASLQLGYLLDNNNIDDRTNKMEGPISSLMHKLENKLNSGNW
ncbi:MAG: hypothetical protein C5B59_05950 [Bacteroidetes bacterium]|nr:MAG: hypothetical protein C5B59_05950 [Bacteroidota bacterium]